MERRPVLPQSRISGSLAGGIPHEKAHSSLCKVNGFFAGLATEGMLQLPRHSLGYLPLLLAGGVETSWNDRGGALTVDPVDDRRASTPNDEPHSCGHRGRHSEQRAQEIQGERQLETTPG